MQGTMKERKEGKLLRIFIGEKEKHEGLPLYEWIVREAGKQEMAGATVIRGMEGFGAHSHLHKAKILSLSDNLPVIIEIADEEQKIDLFSEKVDGVMKDGMVTSEKIQMRLYRKD